jgi:hypothetical protein
MPARPDATLRPLPNSATSRVLPIQFENGYIVRFAEARRTPDDNLQHGLELGRRSADDFQNLRCRRPLFERLITLAGEPRDFCFPVSRGTATDHCLWRIAAL